LQSRARAAIAALFPPLFLFAVNAWICWRLLHTEYLDQMQSIEGSFLALATYIENHWPLYDWFPVWYGGMPFGRTYPPGLHYTVAIAARGFGISPASAYHLITALTYSLGAVTFYYLARALGGDRTMAFLAGMVFSVFSPSTLLLPAVRADAGGFLNARRLQALVVYGEGPNVTGLMLVMLALALLHRALRKRTPASYLLASLALAAVPIVNWTATIALVLGLTAYVVAGEGRAILANLPRLVLIGAVTAAMAFPFELPSTIRSTFLNAVSMEAGQSGGSGSHRIAFLLLVVALVLIRALLIRLRLPFGPRFAVLYFIVTGWVVLGAMWMNVRLIPLPERFHIAMEIPMVLTAAFAAAAVFRMWSPRVRVPVVVLLSILCLFQAIHYRKYARSIIRKTDIARKLEYQEAEWLGWNIHGGPVLLPGSTAFWANAFNEEPQVTGCCLQSLISNQPLISSYPIFAGYENDAESAGYSLLWLKAEAAQAIAIGGPNSRDAYSEFKYPYRFKDRLPVVWSDGDDSIYRIPERAPGLARVVHSADIVRHPPVSGVDVTELRPFVAALDDPALPVASFAWVDSNTARVNGILAPGQAISVAIAWDPGWSATANGQSIPVRADGLSFIVLEPNCSGACDVRLHWSPGAEPGFMIAIALLTLTAMAIWCFRDRFKARA
jgi:hypothetical protein